MDSLLYYLHVIDCLLPDCAQHHHLHSASSTSRKGISTMYHLSDYAATYPYVKLLFIVPVYLEAPRSRNRIEKDIFLLELFPILVYYKPVCHTKEQSAKAEIADVFDNPQIVVPIRYTCWKHCGPPATTNHKQN